MEYKNGEPNGDSSHPDTYAEPRLSRRGLLGGSASLAGLAALAASGAAAVPTAALPAGEGAGVGEHYVGAGRIIFSGPVDVPRVALSFDDGPHPELTPLVARVLAEHDVSATFFCVGEQVRRHPDIVVDLAAAGHDIGNHSWSHPRLPDLLPSEKLAQVERTQIEIEKVTGRTPTLFRPPYGQFDGYTARFCVQFGLDLALWTGPRRLAGELRPSTVAEHIDAHIEPGAIVLLHDGVTSAPVLGFASQLVNRQVEIAALGSCIEAVRARGLEFVTIAELLAAST